MCMAHLNSSLLSLKYCDEYHIVISLPFAIGLIDYKHVVSVKLTNTVIGLKQ